MSLGAAERPLFDLLAAAGWTDAPIERLSINEAPAVLATSWPIAPLACAALGAVGLAVSRIKELRTGEKKSVAFNSREAELAMASSSYLLVDGKPAKFRDPFTGFYRAADGEWVYLHGNFPHLRDGLLAMLGVDNDPEEVGEAVAVQNASDIEDEAISRGLCAARVRDPSNWKQGQQAQEIFGELPLRIERIADAPRLPLMQGGRTALDGLRMLDLSRVIAGPMAGRTMAEHGADVIRIAGPHLPSIQSLVIDTGFGKRSAFVELDRSEGRQTLNALVREADIFLNAYRPQSLAGRGYGVDDLGRLNPHIISASLSAFPQSCVWRARRGYDSLVQATMGMAMPETGSEPRLLPCQPLDYLTGYLTAFAVMVSLIRRHEQGGRWHASLSLAATADWMWRMRDELGDVDVFPQENPGFADVADLLDGHDTAFGRVHALKPPILIDGERTIWQRLPVPLGSDDPQWNG